MSTRHVSEPFAIDRESRPVARVHTGETGTLVPVSRNHLSIWNEQARTVRDRSRPVDFVMWTLDRALGAIQVLRNSDGVVKFSGKSV